MLKNPFLVSGDFVDFYGLLSDRPLSLEEIEAGRPAFATGRRGPRFKRAWLYSSLAACTALSYRVMGRSFLNYYFANKEIRTPGNLIGALLYALHDPADEELKHRVITVMKAEMDETDWSICYKEVRALLTANKDWRLMMDLARTPTVNYDLSLFYHACMSICLEDLDLKSAREVVKGFRKLDNDLTLRRKLLETEII